MVTQDYDEPGISQTIATGSGSDPYASLDRFGRIVDLKWKKGSTDLVGFEYGYDRVSNRLFERNTISTGSNNPVDSLFGFDELNRMTEFKRGELNTAGDAISDPYRVEAMGLDETGNINDYQIEQTPGGIPLATTLDQARTHNGVNEITDITETIGAAWATPNHDDNGNMTRAVQPFNPVQNFILVWDAWNRLVLVKDGLSKVESYRYDGINRRIEAKEYGTRGKLVKTTVFLLSSSAQVLEERVDGSSDADQQLVWGLGYVDHLVCRDRDTNGDGTLDERLYSLPDLRYCVMALADDSGTVVERFRYDALGAANVMDGSFADRTVSSYAWQYLYTGRREDANTGLYFFRARYYHAQLGRFIGRDPLGFVDGMSLYRGYFVPNGVDPLGFQTKADYDYSLCDRIYKRCMGAILGTTRPQSDSYREIAKKRCEKRRKACKERERLRQTPNPAPTDYQGCITACLHDPNLNGFEQSDCFKECKHKYRNRKNRCPAQEPTVGVPDSEGNTWVADKPAGERRYHGGYDCYRSGNFQCCYDCEGNVVDSGPYQGTYDYVPFNPDTDWGWDHYWEDVAPHTFGPNNYYDDLTEIY